MKAVSCVYDKYCHVYFHYTMKINTFIQETKYYSIVVMYSICIVSHHIIHTLSSSFLRHI